MKALPQVSKTASLSSLFSFINQFLMASAVVGLLTGCSFASQYHVIHTFLDKPAAFPATQLVFGPDGNLYGTTGINGGTCPQFCGNVFQLVPPTANSGWSYHIIHTFTGPHGDGQNPFSSVIFDKAGNLYGTTASALNNQVCQQERLDCGTIFELSPDGKGGWSETVLYRFTGNGDGAFPGGPLAFDSSGNLYGTTSAGGSASCPIDTIFGCGVAWELSPGSSSWTFTTLHSFNGSDGYRPEGLMFDAAGNLVGTTPYGGTGGNCSVGCGLIYTLTFGSSGWSVKSLYEFTGGNDGAIPVGLSLDGSGNLYGAAESGGSTKCTYECGTIFELSPNGSNWNFSVVHSFNGNDGAYPIAVLVDGTGLLYGVSYGGDPSCQALGCGVIFKIVQQSGEWKEGVLFQFTGADGEFPNPLTLDSAGYLFGSAGAGGKDNYGVAFKFVP